MRTAGTLDGTSKVRVQRAGWICSTRVPHGGELSVRKKPDTYIEETVGVTMQRQGLLFHTYGPNTERQPIE